MKVGKSFWCGRISMTWIQKGWEASGQIQNNVFPMVSLDSLFERCLELFQKGGATFKNWAKLQEDLLSLTICNTKNLLGFPRFSFSWIIPHFLPNSHPPASTSPSNDSDHPGRAHAGFLQEASQPHLFCSCCITVQVNIQREVLSALFQIHKVTVSLWLTGVAVSDGERERITPLFPPREHDQFCSLGS